MSITKKDIADQLVSELAFSHNQALVVANYFFDAIKDSLSQGEAVKLSGFGNFTIREKTARPGRNPKTGEEVMISARKVATFKAGPKLKKVTQIG